jgi:hypothetical protein
MEEESRLIKIKELESKKIQDILIKKELQLKNTQTELIKIKEMLSHDDYYGLVKLFSPKIIPNIEEINKKINEDIKYVNELLNKKREKRDSKLNPLGISTDYNKWKPNTIQTLIFHTFSDVKTREKMSKLLQSYDGPKLVSLTEQELIDIGFTLSEARSGVLWNLIEEHTELGETLLKQSISELEHVKELITKIFKTLQEELKLKISKMIDIIPNTLDDSGEVFSIIRDLINNFRLQLNVLRIPPGNRYINTLKKFEDIYKKITEEHTSLSREEMIDEFRKNNEVLMKNYEEQRRKNKEAFVAAQRKAVELPKPDSSISPLSSASSYMTATDDEPFYDASSELTGGKRRYKKKKSNKKSKKNPQRKKRKTRKH